MHINLNTELIKSSYIIFNCDRAAYYNKNFLCRILVSQSIYSAKNKKCAIIIRTQPLFPILLKINTFEQNFYQNYFSVCEIE